jgi:GNAT superfamily N-acetyltransferase
MSSFEVVRYTPKWRGSLVALLARVGTTHLSDEEFTWWFDRNPGGEGIVSLAVDGGEVVGVAAMSFFATLLEGVSTRLAIPVNVATDARYRGQGVFSTLEEANEAAAAASGSPLTVTFPNASSHPIFVRRLGWTDLPRLRLWARPLRFSGVVRYALGREGEREGMRDPTDASLHMHGLEVRPIDHFGADMDELGLQAAAGYGSHFTRDAAYFQWRYVESPRDYRCFAAYRGGDLAGVAVVGHTYKHGVSAGFLADLVAAPEDSKAVRALVSRAVDEVEGGADALVLLPPSEPSQRRALLRAGFAPTNKKLRFIGKALHDGVRIDESADAWHFTLGDFDFF